MINFNKPRDVTMVAAKLLQRLERTSITDGPFMKQEMTTKQKRLFESTQLLDDSGCWIWQGQVSNSGYGRTNISVQDGNVKMVSAQTASYLAFISDVPEGNLVKQHCGNRLCINPKHLELMKV